MIALYYEHYFDSHCLYFENVRNGCDYCVVLQKRQFSSASTYMDCTKLAQENFSHFLHPIQMKEARYLSKVHIGSVYFRNMPFPCLPSFSKRWSCVPMFKHQVKQSLKMSEHAID